MLFQTYSHILGAGSSRSHSVDSLEFLYRSRLSKVSLTSALSIVGVFHAVFFRNAETWLEEQRRRLRWLRAKSIELGIYKPQGNILDRKFFATRPSKKPRVGIKPKVDTPKID